MSAPATASSAAPLMVRGLRGATTVDVDSTEQVTERSQELVLRLMERNDLVEEDIVSMLFTATADVTSIFPATAIREIGFGTVPLLCAAEIAVPGAMPLCIRVLAHVHTTKTRDEIHHVYLHGAQGLRDDLPD
jgi:chorismate mutase